MKRLIFLALIGLFAVNAKAQVPYYHVDSSDRVGKLLTASVGSVQSPPYWIRVTTGTGGLYARIGVPLLIVLRDTANDSSFYQKFELDSVSQIVGDSLYVVKRALSNSSKLFWPIGTRVEVVNNDGIIIKQLQQRMSGLTGLPDTTGHAGQYLKDSSNGIGPVWANGTGSGGGSGVTSFNSRNGNVVPATSDYSFAQISGTATVTQGGTGRTSILSGKLLYASSNNILSPLTLGGGLSISSDTMKASGFQPLLPDTTGFDGYILGIDDSGVLAWTLPGVGTVTSVDVSGGLSGLTFVNGPIVHTGTISISGGQLAIAFGGTGGANRAQALQNLLPDSTGFTSDFLKIAPGGGFVWDTVTGSGGGSGTVTSVATGTGLTGGPITTTGTISLTVPVTIAHGGTSLTSTPTNGQLLIGKTSTNAYVLSTLTGTSNEITVTNGSGSITLSTPQPIATTSDVTFDSVTLTKPLGLTQGGSGATTLTGILFGNGTGPITGGHSVDLTSEVTGLLPNANLAHSAVTVTAGTGLSGGGSVSLGSSVTLNNTGVTSVDVSGGSTGLTTSGGPVTTTGTVTLAGVLATTNGGTGINAANRNALEDSLGIGPDTNVWLRVSPTTGAQNTIQPIGNVRGLTLKQPASFNTDALEYSDVSGTLHTLFDPLGIAPVVAGGTDITSYATGDLLYASASNVLSKRAIGTTGQVLTVSGGLPVWSSSCCITFPVPVPVDSGGLGATTLTNHAVILGAGTSPVAFAGPGSSGQILFANGGSSDPSFKAQTNITQLGVISSALTLISALNLNVATLQSGTYTNLSSDCVVPFDATVSTANDTLAASPTLGRVVVIARTNSGGGNAVTVIPNAGQSIVGKDVSLGNVSLTAVAPVHLFIYALTNVWIEE